MADGWIYRYDFKNGDCYVGKEGSFDPFIRAAEHLQDALAVAYPGQYTGFKILFRGTDAKYVTVNRYSQAKVQKLGWQWGLRDREDDKGVKYTRQSIEDARKNSTGRGVSSVYLTAEGNKGNRKYTLEKSKEGLETRSITKFKDDFLTKYIYKYEGEDGNSIGHYKHLSNPKGDYKELLGKIKSWRYISVKDIRQLFQVTPAEIQRLVNANENEDGSPKRTDINLTKVLEVLFGKANGDTGQRSKTNDWINIFYSEVRKGGEKGRKAGASLLDVCEMFATLNAYYEHRTGKVTNSNNEQPEMLNNEILMTSFSSLVTAEKQQEIKKTITNSMDLQKALTRKDKDNLLEHIIANLGKEGNKAGKNVKDLYKVASSEIANIIAERIKTTKIWGNDGEWKKQKTEMFKKVFALLTSDPFSSFSKEDYRTSFNNGE